MTKTRRSTLTLGVLLILCALIFHANLWGVPCSTDPCRSAIGWGHKELKEGGKIVCIVYYADAKLTMTIGRCDTCGGNTSCDSPETSKVCDTSDNDPYWGANCADGACTLGCPDLLGGEYEPQQASCSSPESPGSENVSVGACVKKKSG